jgi:hypothetical protein
MVSGSGSVAAAKAAAHAAAERAAAFTSSAAAAASRLPVSRLFVLVSSAAYLLPLREAARRRSPFYLLLFGALLALSVTVHCEDLALCAPLADAALDRLHALSRAISYFLLCVMLLVVFEVRAEAPARVAAGAWAAVVWLVDPGFSAVAANVAAALALTAGLLLLELRWSRRRLTPAYFQRLGVIAAMAGLGFACFRLLQYFWLWHGVWHIYTAGACFLLLVAKRSKLEKGAAAAAAAAAAGRAARMGGGRDVGRSGGLPQGLTTPTKRCAGVTAGEGGGVSSFDGAAICAGGDAGATAPLLARQAEGAAAGAGAGANSRSGGSNGGGGGGGGGGSWPSVQPV